MAGHPRRATGLGGDRDLERLRRKQLRLAGGGRSRVFRRTPDTAPLFTQGVSRNLETLHLLVQKRDRPRHSPGRAVLFLSCPRHKSRCLGHQRQPCRLVVRHREGFRLRQRPAHRAGAIANFLRWQQHDELSHERPEPDRNALHAGTADIQIVSRRAAIGFIAGAGRSCANHELRFLSRQRFLSTTPIQYRRRNI